MHQQQIFSQFNIFLITFSAQLLSFSSTKQTLSKKKYNCFPSFFLNNTADKLMDDNWDIIANST